MKKLNLKLGGFKEMLTREQMKKVVGGYGTDPCADECNATTACPEGMSCNEHGADASCGAGAKIHICY